MKGKKIFAAVCSLTIICPLLASCAQKGVSDGETTVPGASETQPDFTEASTDFFAPTEETSELSTELTMALTTAAAGVTSPATNKPTTKATTAAKPAATTAKPNTTKPKPAATTAKPTTTKPKPIATTAKPTTAKPTTTKPKPTTTKPTTTKPTTSAAANSSSDFEKEVLRLINEERAKAGVGKLEFSSELYSAAQIREKEIVTKFSHTRPDGSDCFTVSDILMGENIASGQNSPEAVVNAWMNSSVHRENILRERFKITAIGCNYDSGSNTYYWVQLFG